MFHGEDPERRKQEAWARGYLQGKSSVKAGNNHKDDFTNGETEAAEGK